MEKKKKINNKNARVHTLGVYSRLRICGCVFVCLFLTASCFLALFEKTEYFLLYSPPGSIHFLNATELHVLVESTNQNLCVRYSFNKELPMRSPSGEKVSVWFSVLLYVDVTLSLQLDTFTADKASTSMNDCLMSSDQMISK